MPTIGVYAFGKLMHGKADTSAWIGSLNRWNGIFGSKEITMDFQTMYYVVDRIDSDYAYLRRTDEVQDEPKLVARALLPEAIMEGSRLKYEMLQYELLD